MNKIVTGENIVKSYGKGDEKRNVLDGVSAEIYQGEFVSVMGPSGSGKSTLMFALSGMDGVDGGRVAFDGSDLSALGENELADIRRTKMGFVFQQPTLLKNLNILDNIILTSIRDRRKNAAKITEKARALMKKVGIAELEKRDVTQASGGQLQRAGICRALMSNPKIIFGDEPTGALNSKYAQDIMNIFSEINEDGTAVMLVTHDANVAVRAQRIMFMCDGKIVSEMRLSKFSGTDIDDRMEKVIAKMREIGI
ncbi:ABC transporter ATP-binding protein [Ruminiclostridium cellobioparum]|uniref:ABC-type antimicrobial peptide transport system, ATPase component n=1 Tax=Ruminiclostridium cellobioparum subsp. termitidis CT1112 TaxID=1195236 RepID=S0FKA2_RUMCE|nr:ABC transporter ATP-binding protein [Ruminiclostridium cellobioparum]EMS72640.1 ABC-type antimicrobial peptide transport system, ATPase component [Ruminiclostridium cellobioparum subsp. termitidis CT1112]